MSYELELQKYMLEKHPVKTIIHYTNDSNVNAVMDKFKQRSEAGFKKYGKTLDRDDLSVVEWLTHLQEELMDAVLYIERSKKEFKGE